MLARYKYWFAGVVALIAMGFVGIEGYDYLFRPHFQMPTPGERVSLVQLLGAPEKYDGLRVQAAGFFVFREEEHALYLNSADVDNGLAENSIAVVFDYSKFKPDFLSSYDHKYVSVVGRFEASAQSEWPMQVVVGKKVAHIAAIEEIKSPPYQNGPPSGSTALR